MAEHLEVEVMINVNGRDYRRRVQSRMHLADFLRHELGLTGTHIGCEQGICGNCTVLVDGQAIKSCLMFAAQADGLRVTTVESLATEDKLHPLQQVFKQEHGLQCGYCTPGFLMTATALAAEGRRLERDELREELAGVICRCTGYRNVITAVERYLAETTPNENESDSHSHPAPAGGNKTDSHSRSAPAGGNKPDSHSRSAPAGGNESDSHSYPAPAGGNESDSHSRFGVESGNGGRVDG